MSKKTWYFGPTSDLEMCNDDEYSSWVWIADNPDGWLDDTHITDFIEDILPPGFCEECESIFSHTSDSYGKVRKLLVEAGFVESRNPESGGHSETTQCEDDEDEDMPDTRDECTPASEVKLENAPETLEEAIERIQALEQALDNVCYGLEISEFTGKYDHVKPFVQEAFVLLETRIPHLAQDVKAPAQMTIYEGSAKLTDEQVKKLTDQD